MLYSALLKTFFRAVYGEPPDLSGDGSGLGLGLVLVADGVGGLDLCGTGLRYVMGAQRLPFVVKVVPWGHGWGRWLADLTRTANRDAHAREVAAEVTAFRHGRVAGGSRVPGRQVGRDGRDRQGAVDSCPRARSTRPC